MTKVNTTKGNGTTTGRPDVLGTGNNKNATHKKRVVTQTFVVHKCLPASLIIKKTKNFESGSNPRPTFQPKTDGDYIKRVVHGPPGDHTLKNERKNQHIKM